MPKRYDSPRVQVCFYISEELHDQFTELLKGPRGKIPFRRLSTTLEGLVRGYVKAKTKGVETNE